MIVVVVVRRYTRVLSVLIVVTHCLSIAALSCF